MRYFKASEFACKCGCGKLPLPETMELADQIRKLWGAPLIVTSGARCVAYTRQLRKQGIPAALGSAHISGEAVDLAPKDDFDNFHDFCAWLAEDEHWFWMESPRFTRSWTHAQIRPADERIFKP